MFIEIICSVLYFILVKIIHNLSTAIKIRKFILIHLILSSLLHFIVCSSGVLHAIIITFFFFFFFFCLFRAKPAAYGGSRLRVESEL